MAYVQEALGTNGSGITLGPPAIVSEPTPMMTHGNLIKEIEAEQGPFVFFAIKDVPETFVTWLKLYDPDAVARTTKIMLLRGMPVKKPLWLEEGKIRFKQSVYNLYMSSMQRVQALFGEQGIVEANPLDHNYFVNWWKKYDAAGMAAYIVIMTTTRSDYKVPAKLFEFWKANDTGSIAPPASLLGLGLWHMVKRNWFWVGAGAAGGAVAYKALQRRQEKQGFESAKTMMANCGCCGCD